MKLLPACWLIQYVISCAHVFVFHSSRLKLFVFTHKIGHWSHTQSIIGLWAANCGATSARAKVFKSRTNHYSKSYRITCAQNYATWVRPSKFIQIINNIFRLEETCFVSCTETRPRELLCKFDYTKFCAQRKRSSTVGLLCQYVTWNRMKQHVLLRIFWL